jgi:hypothetical protein
MTPAPYHLRTICWCELGFLPIVREAVSDGFLLIAGKLTPLDWASNLHSMPWHTLVTWAQHGRTWADMRATMQSWYPEYGRRPVYGRAPLSCNPGIVSQQPFQLPACQALPENARVLDGVCFAAFTVSPASCRENTP